MTLTLALFFLLFLSQRIWHSRSGTSFFVAKGSGLITKTLTAWRDATRETISTGRLAYTVYGTEINLPNPATMLVRDLKRELESYGIQMEGFMKKMKWWMLLMKLAYIEPLEMISPISITLIPIMITFPINIMTNLM